MHTPKLNLLDLPVDILSLILDSLLTSSSPILLCPCSSRPVDIDPLPVLLSHPALHAIAAPLLFSANEFVLDATGPHARHICRCLEEEEGTRESAEADPWEDEGSAPRAPASLLMTRDALRRMTNLQVRFERLRAWVHDVFVPMLTDMVVQGSLRHLTVWVRTPEGERQQRAQRPRRNKDGALEADDHDLAMFARPPLDGLLRVLADPYLITARLWVDRRRHLAGWCRFHAAGGGMGCGSPSRPGTGSERDAGSRDEERGVVARGPHTGTTRDAELSIDWREVLRVVDPERKEVAVAADGTRRWY